MRTLTNKEEEIMNHFWQRGGMQVRELRELYPDPKPHVNTLSTLVRILEEKGFLAHEALTAKCFKYFARVSREEYGRGTLTHVVDKLFGKSYMGVVSSLVSEEKITVDELRELIRQVEANRK